MNNRLLISNRGTAIILTLPLLLVILVMVQLSLSRGASFRKAIHQYRAVESRNTLVTNINAYASLGTTFRSSLNSSLPGGTNADLQNCVFGNGASPCPAGVELPLALYAPLLATDSSSSPSLKMITGPIIQSLDSSKPALYNVNGSLCDSQVTLDSAQCPFEVFTSFVATCAGGAGSCTKAESISVRFVVRPKGVLTAASKSLQLASVDKWAPSIPVSKILPGLDESASNIEVTLFGTASSTTVTTTTEVTPDLQAQLYDIVLKIATAAKIAITTDEINALVAAFMKAGYTDTNFVEQVSTVALSQYSPSYAKGLIEDLKTAGVTTLDQALMLVKAGIPVPSWMKIVIDSGITSDFYAYKLYYYNTIKDSATLAATVAAVAGLPENALTAALASHKLTSTEQAQEIYKTVMTVTNSDARLGIAKGGWYEDITKMNEIATALTGIKGFEAQAMGRLGICDATLAQNLNTIVAQIPKSSDREGIILNGKGDIATTESLVAKFLASNSGTGSNSGMFATTGTVTGTSGSTSTTTTTTTTTTTSGTNTTTTTTTSAPTPTPTPEEISLISTCTNCSSLTY